MTDPEMRKFMQTSLVLNESEQVDEDGGLIDKLKAAFGGEEAKGRVDVENERKSVLKSWKRFMGAQRLEKDDPEGFKKFLAYWNFSGSEIDEIISEPFNLDNSLLKAAQIQYLSGKGVTGAERGGPFKQDKPAGDDLDSILTFFKKSLGGDAAKLSVELSAVNKPAQLSNDPLGMLGYAFLTASKTKGRGKK